MNLGRVVGRVVSTHKDRDLSGIKLILVRPLGTGEVSTGAPPFVAADAVGAGAGELVIYVRGREAAHAFLPDHVPADAGIVGIVDESFVDPEAGAAK